MIILSPVICNRIPMKEKNKSIFPVFENYLYNYDKSFPIKGLFPSRVLSLIQIRLVLFPTPAVPPVPRSFHASGSKSPLEYHWSRESQRGIPAQRLQASVSAPSPAQSLWHTAPSTTLCTASPLAYLYSCAKYFPTPVFAALWSISILGKGWTLVFCLCFPIT